VSEVGSTVSRETQNTPRACCAVRRAASRLKSGASARRMARSVTGRSRSSPDVAAGRAQLARPARGSPIASSTSSTSWVGVRVAGRGGSSHIRQPASSRAISTRTRPAGVSKTTCGPGARPPSISAWVAPIVVWPE